METLDIIAISSLSLLLTFLVIIGCVELYIHRLSLDKIPIRIHVNGTRGKSSVTRLISAGLRAGGLKTFAKTTGTIPRIINEYGKDVELHRLRSASIGEQIRLIRYFSKHKPDALVMECMAVNPQYQWVSEHKIVNSTLGVITNVRPDHLDEMGTTINDIAYSLSNTIPYNSKVITSEKNCTKPLIEIAKERKTDLEIVKDKSISQDYMNRFSFIEHPENIELALSVCEELGIDSNIALEGMLNSNPDPGALFVWNISSGKNKNKFVSAFAANDPNSTMKVWDLITKRFDNKKCVFLNTRNDRRYRTIQLIELVLNHIKPNVLIVRGDDIKPLLKNYNVDDIKIIIYNMSASQNDIISEINNLSNYLIVGIGNIVGWGDKFIREIKEYKCND